MSPPVQCQYGKWSDTIITDQSLIFRCCVVRGRQRVRHAEATPPGSGWVSEMALPTRQRTHVEEEGGVSQLAQTTMMAAHTCSRSTHGWLPRLPPAAILSECADLSCSFQTLEIIFLYCFICKGNPHWSTIFFTPQSAEGCNSSLSDLRCCLGTGAGPWPPVCAGRGEGMWWGRVGAGGRRHASSEVSAMASESPGAAPSEPWLLLLTTGGVDST